jgi:CheY-like chemotaxis protein
MYSPPPLRGSSPLQGKRVLLIDRCQATCEVRTAVLESHGVEVCTADDFFAARFHWQPDVYDLVMLDIRRYYLGEALEFYEQIKDASPRQRFAFFVGPPVYLSLTWPKEVMAAEKRPQQWAETVKRFVAAA